MRKMPWVGPAIFGLLMIAGLSGCSEGRGHIPLAGARGAVTLDGTPLQDGVVSFEALQTGFAASAPLDADGHYVIAKVPVGVYDVSITPPELPPPGETLPPRPTTMGPIRTIPGKYHSTRTSGLSASVPGEGAENLDFAIESKPATAASN